MRIDINNLEFGKVILNVDANREDIVELQEVSIKCSANKLKKYIIDAKWWAKWCDYTNFDQNDLIFN